MFLRVSNKPPFFTVTHVVVSFLQQSRMTQKKHYEGNIGSSLYPLLFCFSRSGEAASQKASLVVCPVSKTNVAFQGSRITQMSPLEERTNLWLAVCSVPVWSEPYCSPRTVSSMFRNAPLYSPTSVLLSWVRKVKGDWSFHWRDACDWVVSVMCQHECSWLVINLQGGKDIW